MQYDLTFSMALYYLESGVMDARRHASGWNSGVRPDDGALST